MKELIEYLRKLGETDEIPEAPTCGICAVVWDDYPSVKQEELILIRRLMKEWPEYSGSPAFPVPHPELSAIFGYTESGDPKWEGEYGDTRRRLCVYLADQLESKVNGGGGCP